MVDKSTLGIIIFSSLVLLLTLRDVVLVKQTAGNKETTNSDLNDDPSSPNLADEKSFDDDFEHSAQEDSPKASQMNTDESDEKFVKTIPSLKMKGNIQTLKFMFCYSCGYRNMFEQYSQLIRQRFPDIKIVGENYPPATYKIYITQFISTLKLILIGTILFGQNPFAYFNIATPNLFTWATQNKVRVDLSFFFAILNRDLVYFFF